MTFSFYMQSNQLEQRLEGKEKLFTLGDAIESNGFANGVYLPERNRVEWIPFWQLGHFVRPGNDFTTRMKSSQMDCLFIYFLD